MITPELQKRSFIILTSRGVTEEIGRESQELGALRECFMRESLIRSTIQTSLEGSQNHFSISGGTDTQQTEMVDGQVHH